MAVTDLPLPPEETILCLNCQGHIDYAEGLLQELQQVQYRLRCVERENHRLRTEKEEKVGKIKGSLIEEIKEFLYEWDELRRKTFPSSRNVNLDIESSRAKAYRKQRKMYKHGA